MMRNVLNRRRLYIGAWLGLAAALLTANLLKLSQIEYQPLAPRPAVVSQMRLHLHRLDELLAARRLDSEARLNLPVVKARLPQPAPVPSASEPPRKDEKIPVAPSPLLPHLTGILKAVDGTGRPHYCAVLNGNVFAEKDTIAELRIEEISAAGVVLRHRDQRWFLPAPEVYFSISQKP
jgi:hypothetical protein